MSIPSIEGAPALVDLIAAQHNGVLVTLKSDGRPQLSNITYHFSPDTGVVRISITAERAKYRNLQRDARASLHVTTADFWAYAVAEATAELTAVATRPDDDTVQALVELYRDLAGEHPDWDEYRRAMVADQRVLLRLPIDRVYGQPAR